MVELMTKKPILPGKDETQQMQHICNLLGMPTEQSWPGVTNSRYWGMMPKG